MDARASLLRQEAWVARARVCRVGLSRLSARVANHRDADARRIIDGVTRGGTGTPNSASSKIVATRGHLWARDN